MTLIDLDALVDPQKYRKVRLCGREVSVHPLSGFDVLKLAQVSGDGVSHLAAVYEVARAKVPELSEAEAKGLSVEQLAGIIGVAREQLEAVEAGNG